MNYTTLKAEYHINSSTGFKYHYVNSETEIFKVHKHEFFEIVIADRGTPVHIFNGKKEKLEKNTLLFIRPDDIHGFLADSHFYFANLAFSKEIAENLFLYLADPFSEEKLINSENPPSVILSDAEKEKIMNEISSVNALCADSEKEIAFRFKIILFEIFTKYLYLNEKHKTSETPFWLDYMIEKMKQKKNFSVGTGAMTKISGRSREHISRCLKKYFNVTPSQFLTEIRLNYAANMLLNSNLSVVDICFECGFENLSWFYRNFKEKYNCTPKQYRKSMTF